jgi:hypothetical protein
MLQTFVDGEIQPTLGKKIITYVRLFYFEFHILINFLILSNKDNLVCFLVKTKIPFLEYECSSRIFIISISNIVLI